MIILLLLKHLSYTICTGLFLITFINGIYPSSSLSLSSYRIPPTIATERWEQKIHLVASVSKKCNGLTSTTIITINCERWKLNSPFDTHFTRQSADNPPQLQSEEITARQFPITRQNAQVTRTLLSVFRAFFLSLYLVYSTRQLT